MDVKSQTGGVVANNVPASRSPSNFCSKALTSFEAIETGILTIAGAISPAGWH
jgi:hypothetical protein